MNFDINDTGLEVKRGYASDWVESSVGIKNPSGQAFLGLTIPHRTRFFSLICILSVLGIFFFRSMELQVLEGSGFAGLSERNKIREYRITAKRGAFIDRNGRQLVSNAPNFVVRIIPFELPREDNEKKEFARKLSDLLAIEYGYVLEGIQKAYTTGSSVVLKELIPRNEALILAAKLQHFDGIELAPEEVRLYDHRGVLSLSHILGFTGRISSEEYEKKRALYQLSDIVGKEGLEASYEDVLRGSYGIRKVEIDARGQEHSTEAEVPAVDGKNLILTLDYKFQKKAEEALLTTMKKNSKEKGAVIISDPRNGEILAFVSIPAYDNNLFSHGISQSDYQSLLSNTLLPLFPRAQRGEYPSGSTIKMLIAAAALQEAIITPSTVVLSTGGIRVGEWVFPDWKTGGHGRTDVVKALAESVNTFFYMVGGGYQSFKGLGIERIASYLREVGLGSKTGVDLPGERVGFVPDAEWKKNTKGEIWYIGDTYHVAIGQGDTLVTPLQVHEYMSYFANGGKNFTPHFVKEIIGADGISQRKIIPAIFRSNVFNEDVVKTVRDGLRQGVLAGSSRRLSLLPVTSAGKTGTAQWRKDRPPHAWFTGWAPFEKPEIGITVLIEEGEEGSRTAVQVAYDFLHWYFSRDKTLTSKAKTVY